MNKNRYGSSLVLCEPTPTGRKETADKIAGESGGVIIHPYDNYDVMAGQGTIGLELVEQVPDLDIVLIPISGGGMTAGIATAVKTINPRCKVRSGGARFSLLSISQLEMAKRSQLLEGWFD